MGSTELSLDSFNQPDRPKPQYPVESLKVGVLDLSDPVIKLKLSDRFQCDFLARYQVGQLLSLSRDNRARPTKQRQDDIAYCCDAKHADQCNC